MCAIPNLLRPSSVAGPSNQVQNLVAVNQNDFHTPEDGLQPAMPDNTQAPEAHRTGPRHMRREAVDPSKSASSFSLKSLQPKRTNSGATTKDEHRSD